MNTPDLRWLTVASGAARSWPRRPAPWQQRALVALGAPRWHAAIALLAGLGLLLAFQQVVSGAVRQGELRRAAVATALDPRGQGESRPSPPLAKPARAKQ